MNENQVEKNRCYICKICRKTYSSQQSLCNHNKKYHSKVNSLFVNKLEKNSSFVNSLQPKESLNNLQTEEIDTEIQLYDSLVCKFCDKKFVTRQAKWNHMKKCQEKTNHEFFDELKNQMIQLKEDNNKIRKQLEEENERIKQQMKEDKEKLKEQFVELLNKHAKIHPKTLQKINKQLNINNKMVVNAYVKFGNLSYDKVLTDKEQRDILRKQYMSLEESIKKIHFNKDLPEYGNIFITNMKDDIAYVFNGKQFISVRKNDMLNELVDMHIDEINVSLEKNRDKLNEKQITKLEKFLEMLNDDTKYTDGSQRVFTNYKAYKINEIKFLVYNESDSKKLANLSNLELQEKLSDSESEVSIEV